MVSRIPTRFLVVSDTHGDDLKCIPQEPVDVLIHCGDLTEESKLAEFKQAIELMKAIPAALKLVIAGNHDFSLDPPVLARKLANVPDADPAIVKQTYGDFGEALSLFEAPETKAASIHYLAEGVRHFNLANGASLTVYASPYTPSGNDWGFSYERDWHERHAWDIPEKVDVCITHGPPKGVLDYTDSCTRAGDQDLFAAIARTRPQMHCFGHMHTNWGAKRVAWRAEVSANPSFFTEIDNENSQVIETLSTLEAGKFDDEETVEQKRLKLSAYKSQGYCSAGRAPQPGNETIFVNAAIKGGDDDSQHLPWIVELDLHEGDSREDGDENVDEDSDDLKADTTQGLRHIRRGTNSMVTKSRKTKKARKETLTRGLENVT